MGIHNGVGFFGTPSNLPVEVLVISQYKVENGKIVEEWMMFDGLDVLRQIHANDFEDASCIE